MQGGADFFRIAFPMLVKVFDPFEEPSGVFTLEGNESVAIFARRLFEQRANPQARRVFWASVEQLQEYQDVLAGDWFLIQIRSPRSYGLSGPHATSRRLLARRHRQPRASER